MAQVLVPVRTVPRHVAPNPYLPHSPLPGQFLVSMPWLSSCGSPIWPSCFSSSELSWELGVTGKKQNTWCVNYFMVCFWVVDPHPLSVTCYRMSFWVGSNSSFYMQKTRGHVRICPHFGQQFPIVPQQWQPQPRYCSSLIIQVKLFVSFMASVCPAITLFSQCLTR